MSVQLSSIREGGNIMFPEDASSLTTVHLTEEVTSGKVYIRYHQGLSLWKKRTYLEKSLIIVFVISIVFLLWVVLSTALEETTTEVSYCASSDFCMTPTCLITAANLVKSINFDANPCEDFYEFVCGKEDDTIIPTGKSSWGVFEKTQFENARRIKKLLEESEHSLLTNDAEKKALWFYQSCMDEKGNIEAKGADPAIKIIANLGGWPILTEEETDAKNFNLEEIIYKSLTLYNSFQLFTLSVDEDQKNSTRNVIQIDAPQLGLQGNTYYRQEDSYHDLFEAYLKYMTKVVMLLGGTNEREIRREMRKVIELEKLMAKLVDQLNVTNDEKSYNSMNISHLQNSSDIINWKSLLTRVFQTVNHTITDDEPLIVFSNDYMREMRNSLISHHYLGEKHDNITTFHNYLIWSVIRGTVPYLSQSFKDAYMKFAAAQLGTEGAVTNWERCLSETIDNMGYAVGALYVKRYFKESTIKEAELVMHNVKKAFKRNIKYLKWMDEETRARAEEKAEAISYMIGYPRYIINDTALDKKYELLNVTPDDYFQNEVNVCRLEIQMRLSKLKKPVDKDKWLLDPISVNAYYIPTRNHIVFPAGILQAPFFNEELPPSLNYGGMGVIIGHEMTHGFDNNGRRYDKNGNMHQWWNNDTIQRFENKITCLARQYSEYSSQNHSNSGERTLAENIADNGGLKAAFQAYLRLAKRDSDLPLPGLPFTPKQLFFIGFSKVWCQAATDKEKTFRILTDSHSLGNFRVRGTLSNSREFAKIFNCPVGSPLNPKDKCEVW